MASTVGDLFALAQALHRQVAQEIVHRQHAAIQHVRHHRRVDRAGADRVDADAARGVFERDAAGQAYHAMLGGVIGGKLRPAGQPADRRAVDDRSAALLSHLQQLVLHASPDATQINGVHPVECLRRLICHVGSRSLYARIVESGIKSAKGSNGAFHHGCHLRFVRHVAAHAERIAAGRLDLVHGLLQGVLADVRQRDGRTRIGESPCGRQSHAGGRASDQRNHDQEAAPGAVKTSQVDRTNWSASCAPFAIAFTGFPCPDQSACQSSLICDICVAFMRPP